MGLKSVRIHCRIVGNGRTFGRGFVTSSGTVLPRGIVGDTALLRGWRCWQTFPLQCALLCCWSEFVRDNCRDLGNGRAVGGGLSTTGGTVLPPHIGGGTPALGLHALGQAQHAPSPLVGATFWAWLRAGKDALSEIGVVSDREEASLKASAPRSRAPLSSEAVVVSIACSMQY